MKTKSTLIGSINTLVSAVGDKFESDDDGDVERDFMAARCPRRMGQLIRTVPTLSLHLLAVIADGPVSVVGLAARSGQLKGTVSKHVQRLVDAGWVQRAPIPGNRKEIELTLTADGRTVAEAHRQLHDEMDGGISDFLQRYSTADLRVLEKVLRDLLAAGKDGVRIAAVER